ncbi:MAG: SDR family oxidoreductase [Bdellovibrionales bacterium]|nr:SDR family oxidoreductase [Bdellovibrionales bacterium]
MQAPTFFFTGFPGFLGSETLPRILKLVPEARAVLLIQPKFLDLSRRKILELGLEPRVSLVQGDLLKPGLGIEAAELARLQSGAGHGASSPITQIFHYAAVYDLGVKKEIAYAINVEGTKRMIEFARGCTHLERFHHISTCYVSGRYVGNFKESDLELGQKFNNYYEETKYFAELEVQNAQKQGLPAVIYRPGIVVGNSVTGVTQKYDGPYYVIQFVLKQPKVAVLPKLGNPKQSTLNLVPSDFVVEAISKLSQHPRAVGKVFHLSDPRALTIEQIVEEIGRQTRRKILSVPLPSGFTKAAIAAPGLKQLLKIPSETLDYFTHPTQYTSEQTTPFLQEIGLSVPNFADYSRVLIDFVRQHPNLRSQAMT